MRLLCPIVRVKGKVDASEDQVRRFLAQGARALGAAGVLSPVREARRLLSLAVGSPSAVWGPSDRLPPQVGRRYRRLVEARTRRVPFPLLEGQTGFLDFDVDVGPGVFIPRRETEELAERALASLCSFPPHSRALDLGTGSGALALALARARSDAFVLAVDVSPRALRCAQQNARRLGLAARVEVRWSDWFSHVPEQFHLIVANPPYVSQSEFASLEPEVRRYEPRLALDGGPDGLSAVRAILAQSPHHLVSGGAILVEIGDGQGKRVLRFARRVPGLVKTRVDKDSSGKERLFSGRCG